MPIFKIDVCSVVNIKITFFSTLKSRDITMNFRKVPWAVALISIGVFAMVPGIGTSDSIATGRQGSQQPGNPNPNDPNSLNYAPNDPNGPNLGNKAPNKLKTPNTPKNPDDRNGPALRIQATQAGQPALIPTTPIPRAARHAPHAQELVELGSDTFLVVLQPEWPPCNENVRNGTDRTQFAGRSRMEMDPRRVLADWELPAFGPSQVLAVRLLERAGFCYLNLNNSH